MLILVSIKNKKEEASLIFGKISSYYIYSFGALSLSLYCFAELIILLFTNKNFYDSYKVIGLLSTSQIIMGFSSIANMESYICKESIYIVVIQIFSSLIFVLFSYYFSSLFGSIGASLALIISNLILITMTLLWNKKRKEKYINIKYELKNISIFIGLYTFSCSSILFLNVYDFYIRLVYNCLIFSFLIFIIHNKLLKKEEKDKIKNFFSFNKK